MRCGRFFILGGTAGAMSDGGSMTIISLALGMALLAERDLSIG